MSQNGMRARGYEWLVLDDCWHPTRKDGVLVPSKKSFPDGLVDVIAYVHGLGFKFGLYTSVGDTTCHSGWSPGSFGHYEQDAKTFAAWEVRPTEESERTCFS
jgi:alpha-galactosidase